MEFFYLENSGFILRRAGELVLIDCMSAPSEELLGSLGEPERVTVLASHFHGDHFSPWIFDLRRRWPRTQYVLSSDILVHRKRNIPSDAAAQFVEKGWRGPVQGMEIAAWGSTDEGVSFHISWGGREIFHAGDLNCWHWRDQSSPEDARKAAEWFERELEEISKGAPAPDAAFFPVDPRMGSDYYRGAVRFAEVMRPRKFIPMHFGSKLNPPDAFFDEMRPLTQVIRTESGWTAI
jgi:L-ascorbate metabolism protein UlaG (beta-lactamase superfamily)